LEQLKIKTAELETEYGMKEIQLMQKTEGFRKNDGKKLKNELKKIKEKNEILKKKLQKSDERYVFAFLKHNELINIKNNRTFDAIRTLIYDSGSKGAAFIS
jgi:hypothetical protein